MSGLRVIEERWEEYRREAVPGGAPEVQIVECRRAFYAGFEAMFDVLGTLSPGTEITEDDLALTAGIVAELRQFVRDVSEGRK